MCAVGIRKYAVFGMLAGALLTGGACAVAEDADSVAQQTITVQGEGSVKFAPDRANVAFAIEAREATVAQAQSKAAAVSEKVLALVERLKIPGNRVDTAGAAIRPNYQWNRQREENELRGYIATRQMTVTVHDLERLGELIEGGVEAGVNHVSPPETFSSKARDHYRDALAAAAEDARANAQRLAKALGVELGAAIAVNAAPFTPQPMPRPLMRTARAELSADAAETYNVGDDELAATVHVVFEID